MLVNCHMKSKYTEDVFSMSSHNENKLNCLLMFVYAENHWLGWSYKILVESLLLMWYEIIIPVGELESSSVSTEWSIDIYWLVSLLWCIPQTIFNTSERTFSGDSLPSFNPRLGAINTKCMNKQYKRCKKYVEGMIVIQTMWV